MRKILYHGSLEIISTPMYGQGKVYNDYGQGFYCTESLELAKEWSCAEREDGYVNQYEMDETGLLILNLMEKHYSVLHWLAILMKYRKIHRTAVRKALYTFTERECGCWNISSRMWTDMMW